MNSFIQDSAIDLSLDSQLQHYVHLLVFLQCYDSFIPALHLPILALLDFTNLPLFDHFLMVADLHHFFTSENCVTNDVPADFLDRPLPPLSLSTQLLNTFSQAYHDGMKSVKDPRFLGNLPFWVVQYWHDLGCAIVAKGCWSLAHDWLSGQRENADTDLAAAIDEVFSSLQILGWGTTLRGPAASLQVLDLAEFLSSMPMKGHFIHRCDGERDIPINPSQSTASPDNNCRKSGIHRNTTLQSRLSQLGDSLVNEELTCVLFPLNVSGIHWTVLLIDGKKREVHYGDSLDWPWPKEDINLIQRWLREHGFQPLSKVAMINTIHHFLFDVLLFTDKKKYLLCINKLIYLLQGHFSASDNDCHPPSDSPFQHTSFSELSFSRKSSASSMSANIPPSKSHVSLNLQVSPSQPRTRLLRHFSIISWQEYLDAVHEEDLVHSDEQEDEEFSAMLKAAEQKLLKCTRDQDRQRAHCARVKNPPTSLQSLGSQPSHSLTELSRPHCVIKSQFGNKMLTEVWQMLGESSRLKAADF
ncbi:uncharacterized protein EDB93DRAFT_1255634 [Suillus bovinus]|uniref:uncharacterized protein n=1 Tax=Suillus bovinus TaxID=48563 RepID=UPI001B86F70C|nr:uncharacterized protein EDB93DRAFT_1255634 [Suillus bovinus]KAG2130978.1 hypothetical protein EDB93DRAFT_1255634 [Suillus bovinus]